MILDDYSRMIVGAALLSGERGKLPAGVVGGSGSLRDTT